MKMGVIVSTNSNPFTKVKSRELLIFQLCVIICMKYNGNKSQPRLEKAMQLVLENKAHQFLDNPLYFRVEGSNGNEYRVILYSLSGIKPEKDACNCPDKEMNLEKNQACKHIYASRIQRDLSLGTLPPGIANLIHESRRKLEEVKA